MVLTSAIGHDRRVLTARTSPSGFLMGACLGGVLEPLIKKIAENVRDKKANYIFGIKGNDSGLHSDVEEFFRHCDAHRWEDTPYTYDESVDGDHGRAETRKVWVTSASDWLTDKNDWKDMRSVVMVEATREIEGKSSCEKRFYITSLASESPARIAAAIRTHWTIENSQHWSLDISFREDDCRVRAGYAAQNFAPSSATSHSTC